MIPVAERRLRIAQHFSAGSAINKKNPAPALAGDVGLVV